MPKRVIDFDALWASDKLEACAAWAQAEYAWLYGLADGNGSFELTNLRVIWGRVAAIRKNLSLERLEQIFEEFRANGLLFVWEENGKTYGHWTNSDLPGRLPPPSWRQRLERLAPPVPLEARAEYMKSCSRARRSQAPGSLELASQGIAFQAAGAPLHHCHSDRSSAEGCDSELCEESLSSACSPRTESGTQSATCTASVSPATCAGQVGQDSLAKHTEQGWHDTTSAGGEKTASGTLALQRDSEPAAAGPLANEMADPGQARVNLKACLEAAQAQDWDLDREGNPEMNWEGEGERGNRRTIAQAHTPAPSGYAGTASVSPTICAGQLGRDSLAKHAEQGWHGTTAAAGEKTASGTLALQRDSSACAAGEEAGKQGDTQPSCPEPVGTHAPRYAYRGLRLAISERQDWLLSEAFPWVERQAEYRKMESWLEANPLRRPRNTSRFAHNWFSKIDAPTSSSAAPRAHTELTTGGSAQGLTTGGHSQVRTALSEARVGMGPQGPVRVKPEYWEKLRQREEARRTNAPKSFGEARNSHNIKT